MSGPLNGFRIIELGGIGPAPFAAMLLADHGAEVIRVDRPGFNPGPTDTMLRSRQLLELDLKKTEDAAFLRCLAETADGLIEGFRPGTMERLGLGPDALRELNPMLVYARMTGWGQVGPYASLAGHDINYLALTGALHAIGTSDSPIPPLALAGDMGGGGMMLAFAMSAALLSAQQLGHGQTIDCAMVDGAGLLMTAFHELTNAGSWRDRRESNLLDGGAHFYTTYRTSDNKHMAVGAIEPKFYVTFLDLLDLGSDPDFEDQNNSAAWPYLRRRLQAIFSTRTRDQWCSVFSGTDACVTPVLTIKEAQRSEQAAMRESFIDYGDGLLPTPAPRYSITSLTGPRKSVPVDRAALLDRSK